VYCIDRVSKSLLTLPRLSESVLNREVPMKRTRVFNNSLVLRPITWGFPVLLLLGLMLLASFPGGTALGFTPKAPLAYVTQRDAPPAESNLCAVSGGVAVIDTTDNTNNQVVATVEVGPGPSGMAVASNGRKAYVATYGVFDQFGQGTCLSDSVAVLKLPTHDPDDEAGQASSAPKVVATVKVGRGPLGVAITPDNTEVYVTNFGVDPELVTGGVAGDTVSVINTRRNEVVATIPVGKVPAGVTVSPDGKRVYVTNRGDDTVTVISTKRKKVIATVPVQDKPANVVLSPDGRRAYVTNFGSNTVSVLDTETNEVVPVPDGEAIKVGIVPIGLAVTPDGSRVYVVNVNFSPVGPPPLGNVSVIDTATNTVVETVTVGAGPRAVAITADGAYAYVTNFPDNTLSVIEIASNEVVDTFQVDGGPNWVTIPSRHRKGLRKHD
jgi:YVTN family beta-propeller protein